VQRIADSIAVKQRLLNDEQYLADLSAVGVAMADALRSGCKILLLGNGGSAADAQHFAAELAGRYMRERAPLAAMALTVNSSSLTAIGNDYGYDMVFARQLQGLGSKGDVVVGLTTSGNSTNVLRAMEVCKAKCMVSVGMTGKTGGSLRQLVDFCLCVPSEETPRIQEAHILTGHILCEIIEDELFS
jgi:D-sedoheptulose 7-phosphate isomerase